MGKTPVNLVSGNECLSKTDRWGVTGETRDVGSDLEAVGFPASPLEGYQENPKLPFLCLNLTH